MGVVESVVSWLEAVAADPSHGYDQVNRWGPDYDCSSLVITAWQTFGIPLKSKGATYTGNLRSAALRCGFVDVTAQVQRATGAGLKRGDILLNTKHHVATYCGNGKEVEASINERGTARGGKPGDQTGREILVRAYRNYPWDYVLRYPEQAEAPVTTPSVSVVAPKVLWYGKVTASSLNVREYPHTSAKVLGTLKRGDLVAVEENSHWYKIGSNQYVCADYVGKQAASSSTSQGIDVSAYQGTIDWSKVRNSGIQFAILRGIEKSGNMDRTFETNYDGAMANGVEIKGVYHYLYAINEAQAVVAANTMMDGLKGRKITIWLDLEYPVLRRTGRVTEIANAYIDACKAGGYDVGVYSNLDWYKNVYRPADLHVSKFWIARYAYSGEYKESLKPNVGEVIWQWGSKGKVDGIKGNVDMDISYEGNSSAWVVTASQLNIRNLPCTVDPSCKIVGSLRRGDAVNVLQDSLWYKIQTQSIIGWCSSSYIVKNG